MKNKLSLQFFGAAQNVTGSCTLLECGNRRILVDCGLYQERDLRERNWADFPVPPNTIDAVLLTHAHLDHCGRLPKLVKEGFRGPIYATAATADISVIIMKDSAHLQEEDVKYKMKRHRKEDRKSPHPYEPLYTEKDAEQAAKQLVRVPYDEPVSIVNGLTASFIEVGHILGSTCIHVIVDLGGETRTLLFSGDVGRKNLPILKDPAAIPASDVVLVESTYGNRLHEEPESIPGRLEALVNRAQKEQGAIVIPSFAVERTQELLYHLSGLLADNRISQIPVFLDSPMAIRVTEVFQRHPELFDDETVAMLRAGHHPCDFPGLRLSRSVEDSKAINQHNGAYMVIAGSGMCTGGRIKHHLKQHIGKANSTILFVGYQAYGTLGRVILEQPDEVRIHGKHWPVRAHIDKIDGFSAHADRDELTEWLRELPAPPKQVMVTHGEEESATAFADHIRQTFGWKALVPSYEQTVTIE